MNKVTDENLIEDLKKDNINSLSILYQRYKEILFNYFLKNTRDYDVSNDLLIETFERLLKYCHSYDANKKARPWIFQIASNLIKDYLKKAQKRVPIDTIENHKNTHEEYTITKTIEKKDRNKQLEIALSKLKPSHRNIITMYYLLEMSYEDIAKSEKVSINTIRIKVCRILKELKTILQRMNYER